MDERDRLQAMVDEAADDLDRETLVILEMFAAIGRSGLPPSSGTPVWEDGTPMTECYCWAPDSEMFGVGRCFSGLRGPYCDKAP